MRYVGGWGDIGIDVTNLTDTGNWKDRPVSEPTEPGASTQVGGLKAVESDPETGTRYISNDFQTWRWDHTNWFISSDVLKIWPELFGEVPVS